MAYGSIMDRLNETRPVKRTNYNDFIPAGRHDLVVVSIEPYQNQEQQYCARATFVVENSDSVPQGTLLDAVWNMDRPPHKPGMTRDKDRFAAFLNALQGVEPSQTSHQGLARAALLTQAEGGQLEVQPCRGARIKAAGRNHITKDGPNKGKPFAVVDFDHVPQKQEDVAAMRQALDQRMPYTPRPQQQPAPQAQPTTGWGAQPAPAPQPQPAAPAPTGQWAGFFPSKG
jgi:hypothetical protein